MDASAVRRRIVEYLRETGGATVYQIAKALGISYGSVQWHVYVLERDGVVFTVTKGRRKVVVLRDNLDVYIGSLTVTDFFRDLWQLLRSEGIGGSTSFLRAVEALGESWRDVADALVVIARSLYKFRKEAERRGE